MDKLRVQNFHYNGLLIAKKPGIATYTAIFKEWTNDPGIATFLCSDGIERNIPTCCICGEIKLPKQDLSNKILLGTPCNS